MNIHNGLAFLDLNNNMQILDGLIHYKEGPCVRKLLTGLIMYIYPLKIKNIVKNVV